MRRLRQNLDGHGRELAVISIVSAALQMEEKAFQQRIFELMETEKLCRCIVKSYDATARAMHFGRLQQQVLPTAKFPWYDKALHRWTILPFDDYMKRCPRRRSLLRQGVLELLALSKEIWWQHRDNTVQGTKHFQSPLILQAANASCLHAAVETGCWSYDSIMRLAKVVPFAIVCEVPDFCSSNRRKCMQGSINMLPQRNCMHWRGCCCAHQCHRCIEQCEKASCGDVYSCAIAWSFPNHANALQSPFQQMLAEPGMVRIVEGPPPQSVGETNKHLAMLTQCRREECCGTQWHHV